MNDSTLLLIVGLLSLVLCGLAGQYIATSKGRPANEGGLLGMLFGPFGLLIAVLMPTVQTQHQPRAAATESKSEPPSPRRRIGTSADDKAMDFVMDLMREEKSRSFRSGS